MIDRREQLPLSGYSGVLKYRVTDRFSTGVPEPDRYRDRDRHRCRYPGTGAGAGTGYRVPVPVPAPVLVTGYSSFLVSTGPGTGTGTGTGTGAGTCLVLHTAVYQETDSKGEHFHVSSGRSEKPIPLP